MAKKGKLFEDLLLRVAEEIGSPELVKSIEQLSQPRGPGRDEAGASDSALDLPIPAAAEGLSSWDLEQRRRRQRKSQPDIPAAAARDSRREIQAARPRRSRDAEARSIQFEPVSDTTAPTAETSQQAQSPEAVAPPRPSRAAALARLGGSPLRAFMAADLLGPPVSLRDWPVGPVAFEMARGPGMLPRSMPASAAAEPLPASFTAEPAADAAPVAPESAQPPPLTEDTDAADLELTSEVLFRYAVQAVMADRKITPQETQFFRGLRGVLQLDRDQEHRIVAEEKERLRRELALSAGGDVDPEALYSRCYRTAWRDRTITARERQLLRQLAALLGLSDERRDSLERP